MKTNCSAIFYLSILLLGFCVSAQAGVLFVDVNNNSGAENGISWDTAYTSIQEAVDAASVNDEVWVAAGTYTGTDDPVLQMREGVHLYGGFIGTETQRSQRDWAVNISAIDGENTRRGVLGANNSTLDGFTIANCNNVEDDAAFPGDEGSGAGMLNYDVSPTVTNCVFSGNSSIFAGGMLNLGLSMEISPTITNCTFTGNSAINAGGGMCNVDAGPVVSNCSFVDNYGGGGGGMSNFYGTPTVSGCSFTGNESLLYGGGMINWEASPTVIDCVFANNNGGVKDSFDISVADGGGGMYNRKSSPTVLNCTFKIGRAHV